MSLHVNVPSFGRKISVNPDHSLIVPDQPIVPFIEGDGIGADIMPVMMRVVDAAVEKTYGNQRRIAWMPVFAGTKAQALYGAGQGLPAETLQVLKTYGIAIKGPLASQVDLLGNTRSLNVDLRHELDLYACVRPVRYFDGAPSPLKAPEKVNMVVFRENSEDLYAGIEYAAHSAQAVKLIDFLMRDLDVKTIRFPKSSGLGIKPVSQEGSQRLMRKALSYAIRHHKPSVTIVHKGNIMQCTEGAFRDWAYQVAQQEFGAIPLDGGPWCRMKNPLSGADIIVKDSYADAFMQHILLRPSEHSVIATLNLNGDYLSDALAAQVGGAGVVPGAHLSDTLALFEATHGVMNKYAGKDYANPSSAILAAEMMLRHIGWEPAADRMVQAMEKAIASKKVTYDLARLMVGAEQVSCSGFGQVLIGHL